MCQNRFNFYIFLFIFAIASNPAHSFHSGRAQKTPRFEHVSIEDGLSYPNVYGIFQDKRGFLWFATKYGLNRYDGMTCTVYTHDPDNPNSLSNNFTWFLFEDSAGNLWVVTYGGGISLFNPKTESFKNYLHEPDNPHSLSNDFTWYIFEDSRKRLWIATDGGLNYFDPVTEKFTHYVNDPDNPDSLSHNVVTMITEDKHGFLWLGTYGGGLNRFDPKTKRFLHYQHHPEQSTSISNNKINFVFIDRQETLWVGTQKGLNKGLMSSYLKSKPNNSFIHYFHHPKDPDSLPHNRVRSMYEDNNGRLWFASSGGLSQYNKQKDIFINYQSENNNPNSLCHNSLYYVTGDQTGTIWIGTANGVDKFDPGNQQFDLVLNGFHVHSIYEKSNGVFMIGTNYGLKQIDCFNKSQISELPLNMNKTIVTKILSDKEGCLWIASQGEGLFRYDPQKKSYTHYQHHPNHPNSLNSNNILDLAVSPDGIIWIAFSSFGIDKFDPKQGRFYHYTHEIKNENCLISNWTRTILIDSNNMIWIGTEGGISRFNPENEHFTNFSYTRNDPGRLSNNIVNMIVEDSQKNIWIATNGGLNQFNPLSNTFTVYRKKNGLPGNSISAILEDNTGHLWVSTNNGLSKFHTKQKTFRNYDSLDGLQGKQFVYHSAFKSRDGKLYFGGTNGLNAFYPEKLKDNQTIPEVYLTDFRLFNKSVPIGGDSPLHQHISFTKNIRLSYQQNVFSFDFVALNYRASKKNQYAYKLEGVDKDWIFTDSSHRTAKYTNLNPGIYVFKVKASNNDGIWNEKGVALTISILPAFWMTWWFKGVLIFCFIGCGIGTYYWRLRAIRLRNIKLEELIKARTKELKESEGRYQELFDTIHSGVAVFEAIDNGNDFIIREFNRSGEKIEGVNRNDILGKSISTVFPGTIDSKIFSMIKETWLNGGMKYFSPVIYQDQKGESWRENYMYRLPSGEVVSVYNDVTKRVNSEIELRKAKKSAEASEKAKSQFLTNMSHELRTPLNAILGYTQLIRKDTRLTTEQIDGLKTIYKSGEYLLTLINDILDFAKTEADKLKLQTTPVDLSNFLNSIVHMMQMAAHQKEIAFIFEPSSNLPAIINIDAKRLRQVLLNLLGNAVKFTKKGFVKFKVEKKEGQNNQTLIQFKIQDSGIGIQTDQLSVIFEPFEQVGHVNKHTQGTGLGLSISQQLIDLMGGNIQVKSEVGKGTTFMFDISVSQITQELFDRQKEQTSKVTDDEKGQKKHSMDDLEASEIISPPPEELNKLYDLARFGNMELIQKQARYIEQLDKKYIPFATKINHLATEYEDESIVSFVKRFIELGSE